MAECNIDSEQFVGAVTRLVTEPLPIRPVPTDAGHTRAVILATGAHDVPLADKLEQQALRLPGLVGYHRHRLLEQAAAPNSKIAELALPVSALAEVAFDSEAALFAGAAILAANDAARIAVFTVVNHKLG